MEQLDSTWRGFRDLTRPSARALSFRHEHRFSLFEALMSTPAEESASSTSTSTSTNSAQMVVDVEDTNDLKVGDASKDQQERALSPEEEKEKAKQEWVKRLRLKFCIRPEFEITKNMIYSDGTLNQEYV